MTILDELETAARLVIADPELPTTGSLSRLETALERLDEQREVERRNGGTASPAQVVAFGDKFRSKLGGRR